MQRVEAGSQAQGIFRMQGDAEDLPFETDSADRYVSAGSIEYWPDPQRGIAEAFRVLKPGGLACLIGPVYPTFWLSRMMADFWMLFPTEQVISFPLHTRFKSGLGTCPSVCVCRVCGLNVAGRLAGVYRLVHQGGLHGRADQAHRPLVVRWPNGAPPSPSLFLSPRTTLRQRTSDSTQD